MCWRHSIQHFKSICRPQGHLCSQKWMCWPPHQFKVMVIQRQDIQTHSNLQMWEWAQSVDWWSRRQTTGTHHQISQESFMCNQEDACTAQFYLPNMTGQTTCETLVQHNKVSCGSKRAVHFRSSKRSFRHIWFGEVRLSHKVCCCSRVTVSAISYIIIIVAQVDTPQLSLECRSRPTCRIFTHRLPYWLRQAIVPGFLWTVQKLL